MDDLKFAIPAAMMLTTLAALLFVFGNEWARLLVANALMLGGLGQWFAQDRSPGFQIAGVVANWGAVLIMWGAIFTFALA